MLLIKYEILGKHHRVTRLSLTKKIVRFVSRKWSQKNDKFPASFTDTHPFCKTTQGNLDVAIAKNLQNSHAILCYRFATCSLANFLRWLHLNNLAIAKKFFSVKLTKNGHKNIWSVKVGVHQYHLIKNPNGKTHGQSMVS